MNFKQLQFNQSYNNFNNLSKFIGFFILLPFFIFIISCSSDILINDQKNNNTELSIINDLKNNNTEFSIIGEDGEIAFKFPNYLVAIAKKMRPGVPELMQALIRLFYDYPISLCFGAVIAPNVVITAAHCIDKIEVKVGLPKVLFLNGFKQFYYTAKFAKKAIIHEELDMALLLLSDQDYNSLNLQPVSIPDEPISEVTGANAYGQEGSIINTRFRKFKKSPLKLYPANKLIDLYDRGVKFRRAVNDFESYYQDNSLMFLTESQSNLKNKICRGYSGGPIIKKSQNQPDKILALFNRVYIYKDLDSSEDNQIPCSELGVAVSIARNKKWIDESIKKLTN